MKLDSILVAVDFSPASLGAIRRASQLGAQRVRLVHVVDDHHLPNNAFLGRDLVERFVIDLVQDAERSIAELQRELLAGGMKVETVVRRGRPADQIIAAAEGQDLVIVGARVRGFLEQLALGSVAEEVARRSPVPTLILRETVDESKIERILVAVDVAEPPTEALEAASLLADRIGAKLEAVHVIPWPVRLPAYRGGSAVAAAHADLENRIREEAPRAVRTAVSKAIGRAAAIHVAVGAPADEILRYARPTDLIVCGTHGRGALGRLAFGSVATKLARGAPCPVLVVRPATG